MTPEWRPLSLRGIQKDEKSASTATTAPIQNTWRNAPARIVSSAASVSGAIAVDWHFDWFYLIGVLVGVKFLTVGFVRFIEGFVALRRV